jgi:O-antigen/teichoic acid export membrane protein
MSDENTDGDSFVSALFTSGGVLVVGLAIQYGFGFFAKLVIARVLGTVDYGSVAIGITLLTTLSVVVLIGTDTGVGRYLPRHDTLACRRGILLSAFQFVLPLAIVVGSVIVIFAEPIARYVFTDPSVVPIVRIFGLAVPLAAFVRLTVGSSRGMQEALPRVYLQNITLPLTRFALIAAAVLVGLGSTGVAWAYLGSYGVVAVLSLYYLVRHTPLFERVEAVPMRRELLVFSAPLMITATMNTMLGNLDTFILSYFSTTGDVGIYKVAYPLATLLFVVLRAFGFIYMPLVSELHSDGRDDRVQQLYRIVTKWIFIATLPLFLVLAFYPRLVIRNTFGPEYVTGGLALTVLAVGFFTQVIVGPSGNTLIAAGRSRLIMYDHVAAATVNAILNLILIPHYSILGAAIATTVSYVVMNTLYLIHLYQTVKTHPFTEALLRPGGAAIVLWAPFYWVLETYVMVTVPVLIAAILVFLSLYVIVLLRFGGIEREELVLLNQFEERSGVDLSSVRAVAKRFVK